MNDSYYIVLWSYYYNIFIRIPGTRGSHGGGGSTPKTHLRMGLPLAYKSQLHLCDVRWVS